MKPGTALVWRTIRRINPTPRPSAVRVAVRTATPPPGATATAERRAAFCPDCDPLPTILVGAA